MAGWAGEMMDDLQRQLEIGSHGERLQAVRELGEIDSREAYELLQFAAEDIAPQIQNEARRLMRESVWASGTAARSATDEDDSLADSHEQESLF